jgi:hypothetical protein
MKYSLCILVFILSSPVFAQTGDDGWNIRPLELYENNVEAARVSIILKPGFNTTGHTNFRAYINPDIPFNVSLRPTPSFQC